MKVSDNGIGMTEESLARLFEPHFKADLKSEGIGIGLYMVRLMLQAHGGDMCVKSTLSGGSTLEFWLRVKAGREVLINQAAGRQISH
jgi:signal transduction histidine kinase